MVPPDGARSKLPTLSWESVVDTGIVPITPGPDSAVDDVPTPAEPGSVTPVSLDPVVPVSPFEPIDAFAPTPPTADAHVAAHPPSPPSPTTPEIDEPVVIRTTPPAVIVPAIGDVTSGPDSLSTPTPAEPTPAQPMTAEPAPAEPASAEPAPAELTPVELTPVERVSDELPVIREATPVEVSSPSLPTISAPTLAPVATAAPATSFEFDPTSFAPAPTHQPSRRKKRGGLKLLAVLVVLGGLVAAGLVFGQPYLFPADWDDATAAYAEAVEAASGVEFAEPLSVVAEPTAEFAARLQAQFAAVSPEELAQWRALGLASGAVDDATLAGELSGWQDAVYSTTDGQVYHDSGVVGPQLDAQLTQQMAAASLDQQFGWSVAQPQRTLDAAAATSAEVLGQVRRVQEASTFTGVVPAASIGSIDALPPVIGYRLLAPHVYAEFTTAVDDASGAANPLADLGASGPGFLGRDTSTVTSSPTMLDGDVATADPVAKDRSFWYLVFAGYLDARAAHDASEVVVESAVTAVARGATQCVSATFAGTGVDETVTLRTALAAWAAAAPVEMASSFQVLPDGTLQLVSCDPGAGFDAGTRPGVARELVSWRLAELTTSVAVTLGGGGDAEFVDAWASVKASAVPLDLMGLPPATSPTEMVAAAWAGFEALLAG